MQFYYTISARAGAATLASYKPHSPTKHLARGKERDIPALPAFSKIATARQLSTVFDHEHLTMSPMSRFESLENESEVDHGDGIDTPRALTPAFLAS